MLHFIEFVKYNYSYIIYGVQFVGALIASICAIVYDVKHKRSSLLNQYQRDKINDLNREYVALSSLPTWISEANTLYPVHGDGEKRFNYVYVKFLDSINEKPSDFFYFEVKSLVDQILTADCSEKIFYKEVLKNEEIKSKSSKGSENLSTDSDEVEESQRLTCFISRRD